MATNGSRHVISTMAQLEALYPDGVYPPAKVKETDRITKAYQALIEASPFCAMATSGPGGLDCSPRGEQSRPLGPMVASAQNGEASTSA